MLVDGPQTVMLVRDAVVLVLLAVMAIVVVEGIALWWRAVARVPLELARDAARAVARWIARLEPH